MENNQLLFVEVDQEQSYQYDQEEDQKYNEVYVWGDDSMGQLGLCGQFQENFHTLPKICSFGVIIKSISCGQQHTMFISDSGHLYSMGSNSYGQLGLGDKTAKSKNLPCLIESLQDYFITQISCGNDHSLAISENGDAFAWGLGKNGQLGNGRSGCQYEPIIISFNDQIKLVEAGGTHSAWVTKDNVLFMSGNGSNGQLGIGECENIYNPIQVKQNINKVACGEQHTLILTNDNQLLATGSNEKFQLGIQANKDNFISSFVEIKPLKGKLIKDIRCWNLSAAIDTSNNLYIWGTLHDSQTGKFQCIKEPELVSNLKTQKVSIGESLCFVIENQSKKAYIIGINCKSELGLDDTEQRKNFVQIEELNEKQVEECAIGKSGFVVAISCLDQNSQALMNQSQLSQVKKIEQFKTPVKSLTPQDQEQINQLKQQNQEVNKQLMQTQYLLNSKEQQVREFESQIQTLKRQVKELANLSYKQSKEKSIEVPEKLQQTANENQLLKSKCDTLEKKVDSLVKFLENERRLRHELETLLKQNEVKDKETQIKLNKYQYEAEQVNHKESQLQKQIDQLQEENKRIKSLNQDLENNIFSQSNENKDLKTKLTLMESKTQQLEKENLKLFGQLRSVNLEVSKPQSNNSPKINQYMPKENFESKAKEQIERNQEQPPFQHGYHLQKLNFESLNTFGQKDQNPLQISSILNTNLPIDSGLTSPTLEQLYQREGQDQTKKLQLEHQLEANKYSSSQNYHRDQIITPNYQENEYSQNGIKRQTYNYQQNIEQQEKPPLIFKSPSYQDQKQSILRSKSPLQSNQQRDMKFKGEENHLAATLSDKQIDHYQQSPLQEFISFTNIKQRESQQHDEFKMKPVLIQTQIVEKQFQQKDTPLRITDFHSQEKKPFSYYSSQNEFSSNNNDASVIFQNVDFIQCKSNNLLQGIKDKLALLQNSKHELEKKIYNFESKLKDSNGIVGQKSNLY